MPIKNLDPKKISLLSTSEVTERRLIMENFHLQFYLFQENYFKSSMEIALKSKKALQSRNLLDKYLNKEVSVES